MFFEQKTGHGGKWSWLGCLLMASAVFCGIVGAQEPVVSKTPPPSNGNYRIGIGDVLEISVFQQPLLTVQGVRVTNSGTIRVPMVDEHVTAACQTEAELAAYIATKFKRYVLNPQVYVTVTGFNSNPVALIGAVNAPARFDIQRPIRLLELLTYVNGPAANAGKSIQIIRNTNGYTCEENRLVRREVDADQELVSISLANTMNGVPEANPYVESGDIITVSEADVVPAAYVIGNVKNATVIPLREPVTLTRAIAMAGGVASGANVSKVRVSRQNPETYEKKELIINLKEIGTIGEADILLEPNDVVDVPGQSGARKVLADIFKAIVPTVTRIAIPVY